uniref:Fatty acid synthase pseudo-KR domain-containing protein n=1 Tax=Vespula pensylvanica TaxID=30213 RepID=A0A834UCW8_VESPE|nr:hypothetical protein H0235_004460 [Vespula pensylvanica]
MSFLNSRFPQTNNMEESKNSIYNHKQTNTMDPISRIMLEYTYEGRVDARIITEDIRGTRTDVSVRFFKIIDVVITCGLEMHKVVANNIPIIKSKTVEFVMNKDNRSTEKLDSPMLSKIFLKLFAIDLEFELHIVLEKRTSAEYCILLKKTNKIPENTLIIHIKSNKFTRLQQVQTVHEKNEEESISNTRIILVEKGNFKSVLLGFFNSLQKEPRKNIFRAVLIQDLNARKFSLNLPLYCEQLETDLVPNVLRPGNLRIT